MREARYLTADSVRDRSTAARACGTTAAVMTATSPTTNSSSMSVYPQAAAM
jgi:hypothetical protein